MSQTEPRTDLAVADGYNTSTLSEGSIDSLSKDDPQTTSSERVIHHPVPAESVANPPNEETGQSW